MKTKDELVEILLKDFKSMYPNATFAEEKNLKMTLSMMEVVDLEMLASGTEENFGV